jgi:hypothetical protein
MKVSGSQVSTRIQDPSQWLVLIIHFYFCCARESHVSGIVCLCR